MATSTNKKITLLPKPHYAEIHACLHGTKGPVWVWPILILRDQLQRVFTGVIFIYDLMDECNWISLLDVNHSACIHMRMLLQRITESAWSDWPLLLFFFFCCYGWHVLSIGAIPTMSELVPPTPAPPSPSDNHISSSLFSFHFHCLCFTSLSRTVLYI